MWQTSKVLATLGDADKNIIISTISKNKSNQVASNDEFTSTMYFTIHLRINILVKYNLTCQVGNTHLPVQAIFFYSTIILLFLNVF